MQPKRHKVGQPTVAAAGRLSRLHDNKVFLSYYAALPLHVLLFLRNRIRFRKYSHNTMQQRLVSRGAVVAEVRRAAHKDAQQQQQHPTPSGDKI